jgi:hypothetical protein
MTQLGNDLTIERDIQNDKYIVTTLWPSGGTIDTFIVTGKEWRKGEFARVYVTVTKKSNDYAKDCGYYALSDPREDYDQDQLDMSFLPSKVGTWISENMTEFIGTLRGIY